MLARELRERDHLVLGETAHRHGVDLDRVRLRVGRRASRVRAAPASSASRRVICGETLPLQRVDRHVEAVDARRHQRPRVALEQVAVGRQGDLAEPRGSRRASPPGSGARGARAARRRSGGRRARPSRQAPARALDLLEGQELLAREPHHALGRHAVAAAEPAAVGDRDPHVADRATVPVEQLRARVIQRRYRDGNRDRPGRRRREPARAARRRPRARRTAADRARARRRARRRPRAVVVAKADSALPPLDCRIVIEPAAPRHPLCGIIAGLEAIGMRAPWSAPPTCRS